MLDALADVRADADQIVERAATSRRHRRLAWVASGVAAALVLGVGGWALAGHGTGSRAVDPAGQGTVPASPRAVAGALATLVSESTALGEPDSWDGIDASPAGFSAAATWGTADAPQASIMLGLYHENAAGLVFGVGSDSKLTAKELFDAACSNPTDDCQRTTLPSGDLLLTTRSDSGSTALLDSPGRDLVVLASSEATSPRTATPGCGPHCSSSQPAKLPGVAALTTLVEEPALGWQLPASFEQAGDALSNFTEHRIDPNAAEPSTSVGSGSAVPQPDHVTSSMTPGTGHAGGGDASGSASSQAAGSH